MKENEQSLINKLKSIKHDSTFIKNCIQKLNIEFIPNKRTGLYYIHPNEYSNTCYFKSTDGHYQKWDISLKRLNLHLFDIIACKNAIAIVDATKRGKVFPDSLTKTIPIWCALFNQLVHGFWSTQGKELNWDLGFMSCKNYVSESEAHQINLILPRLLRKLKVSFDNQ